MRAKGYETGTESKKQGQRVRDGDRVGDRDRELLTGTQSRRHGQRVRDRGRGYETGTER